MGRRDVSGVQSLEYYYFANQIHSTALITDVNGNVEDDADYYPWGGTLQFTSNLANHYWFTGKERDAETGLDYFGARYYGNTFGRFTTPDWSAKIEGIPYADPTDPQSLNLYSYVRNNPITRIDPTGHYDCQGDTKQCKTISDALANTQKAADQLAKGNAKQQKEAGALKKVLAFYGKAGDKNGVTVKFGNLSKDNALAETKRHFVLGFIPTKKVDMTFDVDSIKQDLCWSC